jgi:xanthine dehydrogenase accessory factor
MINAEFDSILTAVSSGEAAYLRRTAGQESFTRKFMPPERLIILGGGHVAQPVCRIAAMLNYAVTVVDDRPTFANQKRFPDAKQVICDAFPNAIQNLKIRPLDYVCVVTRGHRYDADCLRVLLPGSFPAYLGMIGSRRRVAGLMKLLRDEGFDSHKLDAIHAPIGLDINAQTPAEIAISICAELVAVRRKNANREAVLPQANADMEVLRFLANGDGPRAMLLVLSTRGSTPVEAGALMAIDPIGRSFGTIGGGCSENAVMLKARRLLGSGKSEVTEVDMTNEVAEDEGMVCGGTMRVLIEDMS